MAQAKKCDRCGEYYELYNTKNDSEKINGIRTLNIDGDGKFYSQDVIDFCPDCCEQFNKWLENKDMEPMVFRHGVMGTTVER